MPSILLPVRHLRQHNDADCLAACAAMLLDYLRIEVKYDRLLKLLKVKSFGTPGQNLRLLVGLGIQVTYREGSMEELNQHIANGIPCITLVRTRELNYWSYGTDHAVVVVGFDDQNMYVNDPAFPDYPLPVSMSEFELAWMGFDYRYGYFV